MILSEDSNTGHCQYRINSYQAGSLVVNETTYPNSLIISQQQCLEWPPQNLQSLEKKHFDMILELKPALVLLGTGEQFIMPDASLLAIFHHKKIGIECMHTRAACMTFSALSAEDRNVVAALIVN